MAEWSIALAWKASIRKRIAGSNPVLSAKGFMIIEYILLGVGILIVLLLVMIFGFVYMRGRPIKTQPEINPSDVKVLAEYVETQKQEAEIKQQIKDLKTAEQKEKLETFKRTKSELKEQLKLKIESKEWMSLDKVLKQYDKGGIGIYILYNETKNKYYVGQSKEIVARIKKHFEIEPIARDYTSGDIIKVKFITSNELNTGFSDYRIDHLEKTGIEIFDSNVSGYNKTSGNI